MLPRSACFRCTLLPALACLLATSELPAALRQNTPKERARPAARRSLEIDLSAALERSLRADGVMDEGGWVPALDGRCFFVVPFRYDPQSEMSVSRMGLKSKELRQISVYGIRLIASKDGRFDIDEAPEDPVYEKIEIRRNKDGGTPAGELQVFNTNPPRRAAAEKSEVPRAGGPRKESVPASGLAALILEIPRDSKEIAFELIGAAPERIGLQLVDAAREDFSDRISAAMGESDSDEDSEFIPVPDVLTRLMEVITDGSPAMSALAIGQLGATRHQWRAEVPKAWQAEADGAVLAQTGRGECTPRRAVWDYFASIGPGDALPLACKPEVQELLEEAEAATKVKLLRLIECARSRKGCGGCWGVTRPGAAVDRAAVCLLGPILRSEDREIVEPAVDLLLSMDLAGVDWKLLGGCSLRAQEALVSRLADIADKSAARSMLRLLLLSPRAETSRQIAETAEKLGFKLRAGEDPILERWDAMNTPAEQGAFLTALSGVDLGEAVYSQQFFEMVRAAATESGGKDPAEGARREALWSLGIRQARRMNGPIIGARQMPAHLSGNTTFPVIVSRTARDPLLAVLSDAARRAPRATRVLALVALLRAGYAEETQRAVLEACKQDTSLSSTVKRILADRAVSPDCKLALVGQLLRRDCADIAPMLLDHLDEMLQRTPGSERWRLHAAVKAGLNFIELNELSMTAPPAVSGRILDWMHRLGHMTPQDQLLLAAARTSRNRSEVLERIDLRRAQLVDGQYGVISIVETIRPGRPPEADEPAEARVRRPTWGAPERVTVVLPPLRLETLEEPGSRDQQVFVVRWDDEELGRGVILNKPRAIGGPAKFLPALQSADWNDLAAGRVVGPSPAGDGVGPLMLPNRKVLEGLMPGRLTLMIGEYLRAGLADHAGWSDAGSKLVIPEDYKITLSYASFGSYCGCGPEPTLPAGGGAPMERYLVNVMLILEKIE